jgi:branched-subunit amino acid aminotransferase/4-amino-4-deoxychorismate lyase
VTGGGILPSLPRNSKSDSPLKGVASRHHRQTVIGLAKARGIKFIERAIVPEELAKADEMFVTGSAAEVTPVGEIIGAVGH